MAHGLLSALSPQQVGDEAHMARISLKEEWLLYSGLNWTPDDIRLRDNIAALFDLEQPTERQQRLILLADLKLTLADLPSAAGTAEKAEFLTLAKEEFG